LSVRECFQEEEHALFGIWVELSSLAEDWPVLPPKISLFIYIIKLSPSPSMEEHLYFMYIFSSLLYTYTM
jgi:hypothetical protein